MRQIKKGPEPGGLSRYRNTPGARYDGKDFGEVKREIRTALLRDQCWLCCYCMRRISDGPRPSPRRPDAPPTFEMKVEHWQSQEAFPDLQLAWSNLLGACPGGEGLPRKEQTCDTRKGEDAISFNPQDPAHIATLFCRSTGHLASTDRSFQRDIDERLGLNHRALVRERQIILDRAIQRLAARHPHSQIPQRALRSLMNELDTPSEGKLPALGHVLALWARKRFGRDLTGED